MNENNVISPANSVVCYEGQLAAAANMQTYLSNVSKPGLNSSHPSLLLVLFVVFLTLSNVHLHSESVAQLQYITSSEICRIIGEPHGKEKHLM